jgi:hypothetical protein
METENIEKKPVQVSPTSEDVFLFQNLENQISATQNQLNSLISARSSLIKMLESKYGATLSNDGTLIKTME